MATAVCQTACKFLTMERTDFLNCQCALIDDLDDRLTFLRLAAPPLRSLSKEAEHAALYCFEEQNFALNHVFFQEGGAGDGSIYFIRSGAVELLCREPGTHKAVPRAGLHRMCLLQEGACFASSFTKVEEEFTAAVASTPCKADMLTQFKPIEAVGVFLAIDTLRSIEYAGRRCGTCRIHFDRTSSHLWRRL